LLPILFFELCEYKELLPYGEVAKHKLQRKQKLKFDFCLTVHHQLGKVKQMNQLDATMIY